MLFLTMTGRREDDEDQKSVQGNNFEEATGIILEENEEEGDSVINKKQERQRLEKLLAKYKASFMDSTSSATNSCTMISGLRRSGTLVKNRMIKRVACPVVPAPSGTLIGVNIIGNNSQDKLLFPHPLPDQVHLQHHQHPHHHQQALQPPLGPTSTQLQQQQRLYFPHPPPPSPSLTASGNNSLVSLEIHANPVNNNINHNNSSHRYSCISSSTATSSSSSSDRSEESEMVESWLSSIHFDEYVGNFLDHGYDLPTISRMTPEDLIAIGITNPLHRKQIKQEIGGLNVSDGIPKQIPESLYEWLYLLRLEEYFDLLRKQGYDTVDKVSQLMWEDFEEIGIKKLGHQKRLSLGIKRYTSTSNHPQGIVGVSGGSFAGGGSPSSSSGFDDSSSHYGCIGSIHVVNNNINSSNGSVDRSSFPDLTSCSSLGIIRPASQMHNNHLLVTAGSPQFPSQSSLRPLILPNNENNLTDFEGTATLQRHQRAAIVSCSASFFNKPVAMIAAKTRGSSSPGSTVGSDAQSLQFDLVNEIKSKQVNGSNGGFFASNNSSCQANGDDHQGPPLTASASISSLHSTGSGSLNSFGEDISMMYMSRHNYSSIPSYDSSSSIYATLKRSKKPPPPIPPKRTNSMKTPSMGSTPSLSSSTFCAPNRNHCNGVSTNNTATAGARSSSATGFHCQDQDIYTKHSFAYCDYTGGGGGDHSSQRSNFSSQSPSTSSSHHHPLAHRSLMDNFQDEAFATCVKSLTSRFSQMSSSQDDPSSPPPDPAPPVPSSSLSSFAPKASSSSSSSQASALCYARQSSNPSASLVLREQSDFGGSSEFPPPPTPLCQSLEELRGENGCNVTSSQTSSSSVNQSCSYKTYPEHKNGHAGHVTVNSSFEEENTSSSSSNESLPFANDNVGTIRQSTSSHSYQLNCFNGKSGGEDEVTRRDSSSNHIENNGKNLKTIDSRLTNGNERSSSFSTASNSVSSCLHPSIPASSLPINKIHMRRNIPGQNKEEAGNVVIDDIETMLANLSNQLDAMLEQEITPVVQDHFG